MSSWEDQVSIYTQSRAVRVATGEVLLKSYRGELQKMLCLCGVYSGIGTLYVHAIHICILYHG